MRNELRKGGSVRFSIRKELSEEENARTNEE